jgi:hypothetical protein
MLVIRPASRAEAIEISARLRSEDKQEAETATGNTVSAALAYSFDISQEVYTIRFTADGAPVAIFGIAERAPWFLCTPEALTAKRAIRDETRRRFDGWKAQFGTIWNLMDCRNTQHVRWAKDLGVTLHHTIKLNGHDFIFFSY